MSATNKNTSSIVNNTSTFLSALVIGLIVAAVYIVAFWLLHTKNKKVFQPRTYLAPEGKRPQALPPGFFAWFITIGREPDARVAEMNGIDAYFFVRYIRLLIKILVPYWILSWVVLMPVAAIGPNEGNKGLSMFTIGNIAVTRRLAAHLLVAVAEILYALYLIHGEYSHFVTVRMSYLNSPSHASLARSRTVMVNNLPKGAESEERIREMAAFVNGPVEQIWLTRDVKSLEKIYDARGEECGKLEAGEASAQQVAAKRHAKGKTVHGAEETADLVDRYIPKKKRPTHKLGLLGLFGRKVDTLTYSPTFIREQSEKLAAERGRLNEFSLANSAFVRFTKQSNAHRFAQGLASNAGIRSLSTSVDVMPEDVIWNNLSMTPAKRRTGTIISWALTIFLIIIWLPLVIFVGIISNITTLCSQVKFLAWICKLPSVVQGIIKGILPPVLLAVLFILLPIILRKFVMMQGEGRYSEVERKLWSRFWLFQLIHGFLIVALASGLTSVLSNVSTLKSQISTLPNQIATKLPDSSIFFLTFILTATLGGATATSSRLVPWVMGHLGFIFRGSTPRKVYNYDYKMGSIPLATLWPPVALLGVIGIVYSVVQPITVGFAAVGFMLLYLTYKYMLIWVCDQPEILETGGLYYPQALGAVFAALYVEEILLTLLFVLKKGAVGYACGGIMAFMIILTIVFEFWVERKFRPQYLFLTDSTQAEVQAEVSTPRVPTEHEKESTVNAGAQHGLTSGLHLNAFDHPALWKDAPVVWIARDTLEIGPAEVMRLNADGVAASCENATMDAKGHVEVDRCPPDEAWYGGEKTT